MRRRINYTDEGELTVVEEKNKKRTGLRWKARPPRNLKYVDDSMIVTKVNMDSATPAQAAPGSKMVKAKHDLQAQNLFRRIVGRAESRGMVVNKAKTKVLCVSDALTYRAETYILDPDGNEIRSGNNIKILGFYMDSRPTCHAHVRALQLRMRETTWVLRHLKLAGFSEPELATVYRTVIRPILDFCAVVYHPLLTDEQDQQVEPPSGSGLKKHLWVHGQLCHNEGEGRCVNSLAKTY